MSSVKEQFLEKDLLGLAKGREETRRDGMKLGNNRIIKGKLTVELADIWGFCYGVLYALEEVGRVLEEYPDRKIWVLGDLIHNPLVNEELKRLGAEFIELNEISRIKENNVAVIPAFGTKKKIVEELEQLDIKLINTTCPEVQKVEKKVKEFNQQDYTVLIHGKYTHQESIATGSYADKYLIIRNYTEAQYVCDYIKGEGDRENFLEKFGEASSEDFDPDRDLEKIGLANQTTMLMNDSLRIFELFRETIEARDGNTEKIQSIETICSATQDRQDAVKDLIDGDNFDSFLVVGGHHSSNTQNLARTVNNSSQIPVYHVEGAKDFSRDQIKYLPPGKKQTETRKNWLSEGEMKVGITAGASTPHSQLEEVISKLLTYY